ncbi:hypothetical protein FAI41_03345 [Acetobacteraceae bacterium]|nr:hypothetical protein FAI41_03345 [Acetobacteraceae bacterium]
MSDLFHNQPNGKWRVLGGKIDDVWDYLTRPISSSPKWRSYLSALAIFCTLICTIIWYPGLVSDDAMSQYLQAIAVAPLSDWHPPLMALFWRLEITLFHTANLLNATWISLSALGLYLFLRLRPCLFSLILFGLLFLSPVFFGMNGFIYKDIPLSWLLLIAAALLLLLPEKQSSSWRWVDKILITFLLILCCLLRVNGAFIAVPLLVTTWWNWHFDFKHLAACLGLVLLSLPATSWINHHVFKASEDHAEASLEILDLAGIAFYGTHAHYTSDENDVTTHKETFTHWDTASLNEKLIACYSPNQWDTFGAWELENFPILILGFNKWKQTWSATQQNDEWGPEINHAQESCYALGDQLRQKPPEMLTKEWFAAIKNHPFPYIKHRLAHFSTGYLGHIDEREFIESPGAWTDGGYYPLGENDKIYATAPYENIAEEQYRIFMKKHRGLWSNYGVFWIASALSLFIITLRCKSALDRFVNLMSFASLCYFFGYLVIGVGCQWRYIMPSAILVISALLAIYIKAERIGSPTSRKIGFWIWGTLMFWSCII